MSARIGIEVSADACRIVELERSRFDRAPRTIMRRAQTAQSGDATAAALAALRGRHASVVVWGAPGDHRQIMVSPGPYEEMRSEAIRSLALAGVDTRGALVDIARTADAAEIATAERLPVVAALANGRAVAAALQPVIDAGIHVRAVATPATALMSLARLQRAHDSAARGRTLVAFIAIKEQEACIAVLRNGSLVAARELMWGYREGHRADARVARDIAALLSDELMEFLTTIGGSVDILNHVGLCGGCPDLRGVAGALSEGVGVAVEPLDSLFGIEAGALPMEADAFAAIVADLRLAWAAAADAPAPLSLWHTRQRHATHVRFARAAVAAGIIAGVGVGWKLSGSSLLQVAATPPTQSAQTLPAIPIPKPPPAPEVNFEDDGEQ